jgi:porin
MVSHSLVWIVAAGLIGSAGSAMAQDAAIPEAPKGLLDRDSLTDGWFGAAADLKEHGVAVNATEISELMGVASGGVAQGMVYEGRLELDLDLDLNQLLGFENTIFHANAYQIHGRGPSGNYIGGNFQTVSNIEATRATRLFDLWVEREFLDNALSVRVGKVAADDEFLTSQNSGGLLNATFGWPSIMAQALPSGGPVYPLATPGIRVKYAFSNTVTVQVGLFNGDPAGGDPGTSSGVVDPQASDANGLRFPIDHGPFAIAELSYSPDADAEPNPTTVYKAGIWRQGGRYDDLAVDGSGRSLAALSAGRPRAHDGDFGGYVIADRQIYRPVAGEDRALSAFLRLAADPGDRNYVSFYVDGGLAFKGPFADRADDVLSFGISFAQVSGAAAELIHAQQRLDGALTPAPDYEAVIELDYQVALAPWWSVQPDLEYVFHPTTAAVRPDPAVYAPHIDNAVVVGLRTSIRF